LESVDRFFSYFEATNKDMSCDKLKEYLEIFNDGIRWSPQTLVIFDREADIALCDIWDVLYELQTKKCMTVILVTQYTNVFSIKQVPRLLKFSVVSGVHWMKLIDVIKNPHFNRFEFDRNFPGFKDRSCLIQVKLIFIFSNKIAISKMTYSGLASWQLK